MGWVNTSSASCGGRAAALALMRTLRTSCPVDVVSSSTAASLGGAVKSSSSDASGAFCWVRWQADITVEGGAWEADEGLGGVKVEARLAGTGAIGSIIDQVSSNVAVDAYWRVDLNIKASLGWTLSGTAASAGIVGVRVLEGLEVGEEVLIVGGWGSGGWCGCDATSEEGDGDDCVGDGGSNVESFLNVGTDIGFLGQACIDLVVENKSIDFQFDIVFGSGVHTS